MGKRWKPEYRSVGGVTTIVGMVLILLTIGSTYSYGNMAPYIVSYCRYRGSDPNLSYQTASFIFAAMRIGHGMSAFAGGYLERKYGVRLATFIGAVIFNIAVFASAYAVKVSFYFLLFTYGLLFGIGMGVVYTPPLVCVMKWMPQKKGVVNGLLLSGFGAGSLVFNFVQTAFINPDNLSPDVEGNYSMGTDERFFSQASLLDRVPLSFVVQGVIFSIMQIFGIMLLADPPSLIKRSRKYAIRRKDRKEKQVTEKSSILMNEKPLSGSEGDNTEGAVGADVEDLTSTSSASEASPTRLPKSQDGYDATAPLSKAPSSTSSSFTTSSSQMDSDSLGDRDPRWSGNILSPVEMLKDRFCWQLIVALAMDNLVVLYITTLYKAFGQTFIKDDLFLTIVGACAAVFNALGRIFWGYIADRFSFKVSFMTLSAFLSILTLTFGLSVYGYKAMFFLWVVGLFFSIGGIFSTAPTAVSRAFGSDFVGINYGILYLFSGSLPSLIGSFTAQLLLTFLQWNIIFIIVGAFPVVAMIISMLFNVKTANGADI